LPYGAQWMREIDLDERLRPTDSALKNIQGLDKGSAGIVLWPS